jgi:trimeric autotransporter adhesin
MKKYVSVLVLILMVAAFSAKSQNYAAPTGAGNAGTNNTSVGALSGDVVTGTENTFLGFSAGKTVGSSSYNTFVGGSSGLAATGSQNTFIGAYSFRLSTTGGDNSGLGYKAGYSNTTGSLNSYFGGNAGYSNTTGSNNAFFGYYAGYSTVASNNVFIGSNSGRTNISGTTNVYLGYQAGYSSTGSNNVFIGNSAGYNELGSDKLYIDNSNTATPLVYGNFSTNQVGINIVPTGTDALAIGGAVHSTGNLNTDAGIFLSGNASISPDLVLKTFTGGTASDRLTIVGASGARAGYIGVGSIASASIAEQLHVWGNARSSGNILSDAGIFISGTSSTSPDLVFKTFTGGTTSDRLTIVGATGARAGYVGIGSIASASIAEQLHVAGNTRVSGNLITDAGILNVNHATNSFKIQTNGVTRLTVLSNGKVGIGTTLTNNPNNYDLAVNGKIGAKDIQLENSSTTWADYVFDAKYKLTPLTEVEKYIKSNQHLEGIPSAESVRKDGYSLSQMDEALLKKVEELTLYVIEQQKEIDALKKQVSRKNRKN